MSGRRLTRRQVVAGGIVGMASLIAPRGAAEAGAAATAAAAGTLTLGGDLVVNRMGFGAMRITGPGIWGEPKEPAEAHRVLRRAVELGVNFIDTADAYGPEVSERLIAEALHPYPQGLVIATKGGLVRPGPSQWVPDRYNIADRSSADVLALCEHEGLAFIPWAPIARGSSDTLEGNAASKALDAIAHAHGVSVYQVAIAWLLATPAMLPIPGTSSV